MRTSFLATVLGVVTVLGGCEGDASTAAAGSAAPAPSYMGAADGAGGDQADRACRVVLDSVIPNEETADPADKLVLVRAPRTDAAAEVNVRLLYRVECATCSSQGWEALEPIATDCADGDASCLYRFRVLAHHPVTTRLLPYIEENGGRLFDHNRPEVAGDYDHYVLDGKNDWQLPTSDVCQAPTVPQVTGDSADRECRVVLHAVVPHEETPDPADKAVLVRALRSYPASAVGMLSRVECTTCSQQGWEAIAPIATDCSGEGLFCTHTFRVLAHYPVTALLLPFVQETGGRLFDHNRPEVVNDFDHYVLDGANSWLLPAADVCQ
jgi:hypothetical protein